MIPRVRKLCVSRMDLEKKKKKKLEEDKKRGGALLKPSDSWQPTGAPELEENGIKDEAESERGASV